MSPFDDGWLLDLLAVEIRLNDPRAISTRETIAPVVQPLAPEGQSSTLLVAANAPRTGC
jgi:hypothetical protein